ncbi:MAG: 1-acyl-sn-glycerol-3-phosphate acyltransferase [Chloroflexi bacterium]|nr:1-acyl-sn-glycerol-3-phosphate acyltransferase [Chloroflexota bacterium]MBI3340100.1 1-acyl-sn-glycerol-3-phosphate acyltransferase [Chloroflexota bacterium]
MPANQLYDFAVQLVHLYARTMLKLDIRWRVPLPAGPKLFIANHPSASDPFLIHLLSSKHLSVLISGNAFAMPLFGRFLHHCGQISVNAGQGKNALDQAQQRLQSGRSVGIFPEGLVSPQSGGCHPPRTGAARLALMTGVPVIPIGIYLPRERSLYIGSKLSGKHTAAYWYLRGPYGMTVGEPMLFTGDIEDQSLVHSVTNSMMAKIHELAEESEQRVRFAPSGARLPAV